MRRILCCLGFLLALWCANFVRAESLLPIPAYTAHVVDNAGVLSEQERRALENSLAVLERQKGAQIAVLLVPSIASESIEHYALRVAEAWKLGRKNVDDGTLLLVALKERKLRIEVGYGLEGSLSDVVAKRIINDTITPYFKQGRYFEGLDAGVAAIIKVIDGEDLPAPTASDTLTHSPTSKTLTYAALAVLAAYFFLAVIVELKRSGGRTSVGGAVLSAALGFLFAAIIFSPLTYACVSLSESIFGLTFGWRGILSIIVLMSTPLAIFLVSTRSNGRVSRSSRHGAWVSSSNSSGWSSSDSGSSSSDFGGGGGGSFGGGGASGGW